MVIKEKFTLADMQTQFNSLEIRYTMETMRYCAEKDINLATITYFSLKNLFTLIMLGTKGISETKAEEVISKWYEKGLSFPMLHTLAVQEARNSGFFITEADTAAMSEMDMTDLDTLKTVLPQVMQELEAMRGYSQGLKTAL